MEKHDKKIQSYKVQNCLDKRTCGRIDDKDQTRGDGVKGHVTQNGQHVTCLRVHKVLRRDGRHRPVSQQHLRASLGPQQPRLVIHRHRRGAHSAGGIKELITGDWRSGTTDQQLAPCALSQNPPGSHATALVCDLSGHLLNKDSNAVVDGIVPAAVEVAIRVGEVFCQISVVNRDQGMKYMMQYNHLPSSL